MQPTDPVPEHGGSDAPNVSNPEYDRLTRRIDDLESKLSDRLLTAEDEERKLRLAEISQRMSIRRWTARLAGFVVFAMIGLIVWAKLCATSWWLFWAPKHYPTILIVAPTLAITTIVVALLLGAFRRFKDDDPEKVAMSAPVSSVVNALNGNY